MPDPYLQQQEQNWGQDSRGKRSDRRDSSLGTKQVTPTGHLRLDRCRTPLAPCPEMHPEPNSGRASDTFNVPTINHLAHVYTLAKLASQWLRMGSEWVRNGFGSALDRLGLASHRNQFSNAASCASSEYVSQRTHVVEPQGL
jgi:hypothetical protein